MTHRPPLLNHAGPTRESPHPRNLTEAIGVHISSEVASFHVPAHKGRFPGPLHPGRDLTEIGDLDDLSAPSGVLEALETRLSKIYQSGASLVSVNGASGALSAAIISCASRGSRILAPAHLAHKSAVNAMVIAGLEPVWYPVAWNDDWELWEPDSSQLFDLLGLHGRDLACVLVTSPTYSGKTAPIAEIAEACRSRQVALVVDEAHGAHTLKETGFPPGALAQGADLVAHSLHKTVGALTQTGVLHLASGCPVEVGAARAALNLLQSTSPSYLLLESIDYVSTRLDSSGAAHLGSVRQDAQHFRDRLSAAGIEVYGEGQAGHDVLHCLIRVPGLPSHELFTQLCDRGIYPEARIGNGVLLLIGTGTTAGDLVALEKTLAELRMPVDARPIPLPHSVRLPDPEQARTPRRAFFAPSQMVSRRDAAGRISSDCVAPCPPGTPVLVPGQSITEEILGHLAADRLLRVVAESSHEGDT